MGLFKTHEILNEKQYLSEGSNVKSKQIWKKRLWKRIMKKQQNPGKEEYQKVYSSPKKNSKSEKRDYSNQSEKGQKIR